MRSAPVPFVQQFSDRHGKRRYYLRRRGYPSIALPNPQDEARFMKAYLAGLDAAPPRKGLIYFVAMGDFIKIGFATNMQKRLYALQVGAPKPLEVMHVHRGTTEDEAKLHRMFKRLNSNGEWFEKAPELMQFIGKLQSGWRPPIFGPEVAPCALVVPPAVPPAIGLHRLKGWAI